MNEFERLLWISDIVERKNIISLILYLKKLRRILLHEELIDDYEILKD
jgi:hypothetical protein